MSTAAKSGQAKPGFDEAFPEAHQHGLVGNGIGKRQAEEAPEGKPVGALCFALGVGQAIPLFEQQHLEADERIVGRLAGGAVETGPMGIEGRPVDEPLDFEEKVVIENGQIEGFVAKGFLRLGCGQA